MNTRAVSPALSMFKACEAIKEFNLQMTAKNEREPLPENTASFTFDYACAQYVGDRYKLPARFVAHALGGVPVKRATDIEAYFAEHRGDGGALSANPAFLLKEFSRSCRAWIDTPMYEQAFDWCESRSVA